MRLEVIYRKSKADDPIIVCYSSSIKTASAIVHDLNHRSRGRISSEAYAFSGGKYLYRQTDERYIAIR